LVYTFFSWCKFSLSSEFGGYLLELDAVFFLFQFAIPKYKKISRTIILPVVSYKCKTWSLTYREERRLKIFENKVPKRIFGPKRDEVTREWRRLRNKEFYALYSSLNIIRVNE
jgi:hypothetical protein